VVAIRWDDLEFDDDPSPEDLWFAALAAERPHVASSFLSLVDAARPAWHGEAACRGRSDLSWFAAADQAATTAICAGCPAAAPCAQAGRREPYGVWAGRAGQMAGTQPQTVRAPRQAPRPCGNCWSAPARASERCPNCYAYWRRTGRERPEELIVAQNVERHEAGVEASRAMAERRAG